MIKQHTTVSNGHKSEDTSEESGETCLPRETLVQVAIHIPTVKTLFGVFSIGR
jgi:hypothetical protein